MAKSSIKIHKIKKFKRHFSFGEIKSKKKLNFDDETLSFSGEINGISKPLPIMKKLTNFLSNINNSNDNKRSNDKELKDDNLAHTYVSFQDDINTDFSTFCSEGEIQMDFDDDVFDS